MKILALANGNIAHSTQRLLEEFGFQVDRVEIRLGHGAPDPIVADLARKENRVLISGDKSTHYRKNEILKTLNVPPLCAQNLSGKSACLFLSLAALASSGCSC